MSASREEVTQLLIEWGNGDQEAFNKLIPLVYRELRQMAHRYQAYQSPGHSLQTTALIHEAYLKLAGQHEKHWQNRAHFFGVAAHTMRHILVDYARSRRAGKRGGGVPMENIAETVIAANERAANLVALDDALKDLARVDERKSRIVELRYFGGLSVEETAEVLKVSPATVKRDWSLAKAWLHRELSRDGRDDQ